MQAKMTYAQQLNHPLWRQKRDAILARDNFTCLCGATEKLHVHHMKYTGYAWEAPDNDLITLCSDCHRKVHTGELKLVVEQAAAIEDNILIGGLILASRSALAKATKEVYRATPVLLIAIENILYDNVTYIRSSVIANSVKKSRATIAKHVKALQELSIIQPDDNDILRGILQWRICPFLGWKGKVSKLHTYLKTLPKDHPWFDYNVTE
jgi:hypothetical protein